jgi:hypothetical protein
MVKAVIRLDVPDWQIGQDVTVYFIDTMCKYGICEKESVDYAKEILCQNGWEKMRFPDGSIGKWDDPEIVRCKDCKHGEKVPTFKYYPDVTWCNKYLISHNDDWYCADGVEKDE